MDIADDVRRVPIPDVRGKGGAQGASSPNRSDSEGGDAKIRGAAEAGAVARIASLLLLVAGCMVFTLVYSGAIRASIPIAAAAYGASILFLLAREIFFSAALAAQCPATRRVRLSALAVVVGVAAFARLRYVLTVPPSYGEEAIEQLYGLAARFYKDGFFYIAFSSYTSTLQAYAMAVVWKLFGEGFTQIRFYMAFLGIASAAVMFWWLRQLFGLREAFIGGVLFATSPYHQWASKLSMPHPYIPLFAMLFCGLLYRMLCSPRKVLPAILAAAIFAVGIHGHWNFVLYAPIAFAFIIGCALTERRFLRKNILALVMLFAASALFLYPLYVVSSAKILERVGWFTGRQPIPLNERLGYCLFSARACLARYALNDRGLPVAGAAVLIAMPLGGILSVMRCWRSRAHALLLLLFVGNLIGVAVTTVHDENCLVCYPFHLLFPCMAFVSIAMSEAWGACSSLAGRAWWRRVVGVGACAVLAWCVTDDCRLFFGKWIFNEHILRPVPGYWLCSIADRMCIESEHYDMYIMKPGYQYDPANNAVLYAARRNMPAFAPLKSLREVPNASDCLPGTPTQGRRGALLYLPPTEYWKGDYLARLAARYPDALVTPVMAPPPYGEKYSPVLLRVEIPYETKLRQTSPRPRGVAVAGMPVCAPSVTPTPGRTPMPDTPMAATTPR